jgi:hypothetical protein
MGNDASTLRSSQPKVLIELVVPLRLEFGECLYVVGSAEELGSWNPSAARRLFYRDNIGPEDYWKCVFELPAAHGAHGNVEYKYIIKRGEEVRWEVGSNRTLKWATRPPIVDPVTGYERLPEWFIKVHEKFHEEGYSNLDVRCFE